jgi:GH25 family lysozyme M1 (1,4-beta-N-acetylmuramidase)
MSQAQAQMYLEQTSVGPDTETVYDIQRGYLRVNSLSGVERNSYDMERITEQNGYKYYTDEAGNILSEAGVDVSQFQGDIDWEMLKQSGISFAMLRAGFRGYGSGKLMKDEKFEENVKAASAQGIKIGVYFFSAAVDEEEAVEEADYVAGLLQGHDIQMPVVIDTEAIYYDDARTDDLTPSQLTAIIRAFCGRIREYGYTPMIYANAKRLTCVLHLEELSDIEVWYADYQEKPIYPYAYRMWQYTEHGNAPGIEAEVDLNVYFRGNY